MALHWYGERGMVNALLLDLIGPDRDSTAGARRFLSTVEWASSGERRWTEEVVSIDAIVEVNLYDFGSPDILLVARTANDEAHLVFCEAKATTYRASAVSNKYGMVNSYNSTINGQLALRYRFSHALAAWDRSTKPIVEPEYLYRAYKADPPAGLKDYASTPRRIGKPSVLALLRRVLPTFIPVSRCHFVAITWDREPFFNIEDQDADLMPLILGEAGRSVWPELARQVGWIGFPHIEAALQLSETFVRARETMLATKEPPAPTLSAYLPSLKTKPLTTYSTQTLLFLERLVNRAQEHFKDVERKPGSISVKLQNKTRLKLIPYRFDETEEVLLGVHIDEPASALIDHPSAILRKLQRGQVFRLLPLDEVSGLDTCDAVFQQLAECYLDRDLIRDK